jgi:TrmH family RNA methyltransferase
MIHRIDSRSNPRVKDLLKQKDRYLFFEGEKLVKDILEKKIRVKLLIILNTMGNPPDIPGTSADATWIVNETVMEKLSSLKEKPTLIAVLEPTEKAVDFHNKKAIIGLDDIQDPANAGTIFRCAAAFGIDAVVFSGNSVKPSNPKFLRAAQDAFFQVPFQHFDSLELLIAKAKRNNFNIYLTSSHKFKKSLHPDALQFPCLILLGNEGKGLPENLFNHYPSVTIPQTDRVESLNVGVSACIIMHELRKYF